MSGNESATLLPFFKDTQSVNAVISAGQSTKGQCLSPRHVAMAAMMMGNPLAAKLLCTWHPSTGEMPMFKEHAAVWIWDTGWWPAYVVNPALDLEGDTMLVRFENGVTAPVKASEVLQRESRPKHFPTPLWQSSRS